MGMDAAEARLHHSTLRAAALNRDEKERAECRRQHGLETRERFARRHRRMVRRPYRGLEVSVSDAKLQRLLDTVKPGPYRNKLVDEAILRTATRRDCSFRTH
jgi:hypothetical protein